MNEATANEHNEEQGQEQKARPEQKAKPEQKERFYCIKVAPMRDKMDIPVPIVQAGNKRIKHPRIQLKRGSWVPVPEGAVEVLEHSKFAVWTNVEGEDRKVKTMRIRYPLEGKMEITEKGYRALRQKALKGEITEADIAPYKI